MSPSMSSEPEYILEDSLEIHPTGNLHSCSDMDWHQVEAELVELSAACIRLVDISREIATDMAKLALSLQEQE